MLKRLQPSWNFIAILNDCAAAAASLTLALYLRLGDRFLAYVGDYYLPYTALFTLILLAVLLKARTYRRVWRYTSFNDLLAVARLGAIALVLFYGVLFFATRMEHMPRSIPFIHALTLMFCLMGGRLVARVLLDPAARGRLFSRAEDMRVPVLLVGLTPQAEAFIRESERSLDFPYRAVGIISEDDRARGREVHGVRVYGNVEALAYILTKLTRKSRTPQRLLLAEPNFPRPLFEALMKVADSHQLSVARLPSLAELKAGKRMQDIHPVAVEDILGRTPAVLDREAMGAFVRAKRVLVTGAGGSIGSELVRQIAAFDPAEILLYELAEYSLYQIDRELAERFPTLVRHAVMGDIRDAAQLDRCFAEFRPDVVFHAAAVKHVPLSEINPGQAVLTNIHGSKQVADACVKHQVYAMVQVSTDKAVNPTSLMGATKRVAEIYGQALAQQGAATHFVTVRFGNVLNSAGSVVPLFQEQIAKGGPVTITHRDMVRYFMTISEATQLILQAAVLGVALPDAAPIFVLDMGAPVRIEDLACQMIRLAGFAPHKDIAIRYTGLRPGEKLYEELFHEAENLLPTAHQSIRLAQARQVDAVVLGQQMALLVEAAAQGRAKQLPLLLKDIVSEYQLPEVKASNA